MHRWTAHIGLNEKGELELYVNSPISLNVWGTRLERGLAGSGNQFPQTLRDFYTGGRKPELALKALPDAQDYLDRLFNKIVKTKKTKTKAAADSLNFEPDTAYVEKKKAPEISETGEEVIRIRVPRYENPDVPFEKPLPTKKKPVQKEETKAGGQTDIIDFVTEDIIFRGSKTEVIQARKKDDGMVRVKKVVKKSLR